jgi:hypothetical protein
MSDTFCQCPLVPFWQIKFDLLQFIATQRLDLPLERILFCKVDSFSLIKFTFESLTG